MALRLTAEERAFILKRRETAKQREAEKAAIMHGLYAALSLPFDQAYPIVRELTCKDYRLAFDARVAAWCAANSKAVLAANKMRGK